MNQIIAVITLFTICSFSLGDTIYLSFDFGSRTGTVQVKPAGHISVSGYAADNIALQSSYGIEPNKIVPPSVKKNAASVASFLGYTESVTDIVAACYVFYVPLNNCTIYYYPPTPEPYTGGHIHDDESRPAGTIEPMIGYTGSDYSFTFKYTAPDVSGLIRLTGYASHPDYGIITGSPYIIAVDMAASLKVGSIKPLPDSSYYELIGQHGTITCNQNGYVTSEHVDNHNATPEMIKLLDALTYDFNYFFLNKKLKINDVSLEHGGLFDIDNNWNIPHSWHRTGMDADICAYRYTRKQVAILKGLARHYKFKLYGNYPSHIHLRLW